MPHSLKKSPNKVEQAKKTVTSDKLVAADGTQRGVVPRTKAITRPVALLQEMQKKIQAKYRVKNFDPVVMMAMIGMECLETTLVEVVDPETGETRSELVPPDRALALTAFGKAAPYVRATLKTIELVGDDDRPISIDINEAKAQFAEKLGKALTDEIIDITPDDDEEEL